MDKFNHIIAIMFAPLVGACSVVNNKADGGGETGGEVPLNEGPQEVSNPPEWVCRERAPNVTLAGHDQPIPELERCYYSPHSKDYDGDGQNETEPWGWPGKPHWRGLPTVMHWIQNYNPMAGQHTGSASSSRPFRLRPRVRAAGVVARDRGLIPLLVDQAELGGGVHRLAVRSRREHDGDEPEAPPTERDDPWRWALTRDRAECGAVLPTLESPSLIHGDCLDALADLEPASIDAIVHDPPAGIAFMGREWDDKRGYKPRTERGQQVLDGLGLLGLEPWASGFVAFMTEVFVAELRVVKPGAHSLTWALPRTADLTMLALRLAGWECRDVVTHLFGGGMPKSHDVSKAIDKMHGAEREVVGDGPYASRRVHSNGGTTTGAFEHDGHVLTAPATDDAKRWEGWGTALSPGHEQWILARAPLVGTVARNVLEYGTGAINIDACRTGTSKSVPASPSRKTNTALAGAADGSLRRATGEESGFDPNVGRWPKNALLSCSLACEGDRHTPWCPVGELDRQSGTLHSRGNTAPENKPGFGSAHTYGDGAGVMKFYGSHDQVGGASRFFPRFGYHPKASDRTIAGRPDLTNKHPTHKSPELMRWLVRLITPPGGVVLDDFMGSGTTGVAAIAEGCRFIGIEREQEHFEVARARVLAAVGSPEFAAEANAAAPVGAQLGLL